MGHWANLHVLALCLPLCVPRTVRKCVLWWLVRMCVCGHSRVCLLVLCVSLRHRRSCRLAKKVSKISRS